MRKKFFQVVSLGLALAVPHTGFATGNAAMLFPQGKVTVNGTPLMRSTALFAGDKVSTGEQGTVTLSMPGSAVQINSQSEVQYDAGQLRVSTGSVLVNTQRGLKAQLLNLTVTPDNPKARFNLGQRNDKVVIAALEGAVRVSDGKSEMLLQPGKAIMFAAPKPAGAQAGAGAGALFLSNAAAIGISGAAFALGATLAFTTNETITPAPASPIQ
ncbi:MAG TPA: hypothetical protein VFA60_10520 [Terriglobales bacterium]|nr:hypothetical protein [Terriglobales bacterium]